jgi:hypothetical protein
MSLPCDLLLGLLLWLIASMIHFFFRSLTDLAMQKGDCIRYQLGRAVHAIVVEESAIKMQYPGDDDSDYLNVRVR